MEFDTELRPGPNRYLSGDGVLKNLPEYLAEFKDIAVITGTKSFRAFTDYYGNLNLPIHVYDGSSSVEDGKRLAEEIGSADVILAIGGGRVMDTAKLARGFLGCELVTIPTIVSNCAPYAPVIAIYTQNNHEFVKIGYSLKAPYLTLVDWRFLLETPKEFYIAGIGDTLAKWYECEAITRNLDDNEKSAGTRLGIATAKEILDILLQKSNAALTSLAGGQLTPSFGLVTDTIIELAGCVGGFAAKFGRVSGAHAIHDALSLIPETHDVEHGAKVAYGILVQLAYLGENDEITRLKPRYQDLGLPTSISDIGLTVTDSRIDAVAEFAASRKSSFFHLDDAVTADGIKQAIFAVEDI